MRTCAHSNRKEDHEAVTVRPSPREPKPSPDPKPGEKRRARIRKQDTGRGSDSLLQASIAVGTFVLLEGWGVGWSIGRTHHMDLR